MQNLMHRRNQRKYWILFLLLFSLAGFIAVAYATVWGAALSDDSYFYISPARSLLSGQGFNLTAKYPPALPLILSVIGLIGVDPLISIRWLNAILFSLDIFLLAAIIFSLTKSYAFSLIGAFLTLISSTLIMVHSWAMSEALFISFTLAGLLIYSIFQRSESREVPFFTGLFFGLAAATRYVGISLLLAGGIFWLVEPGRSFRARVRKVLIFSLVGVAPLVAWLIHNTLTAGQPISQEFGWYPMPASQWVSFLNTIFLWFIPGRFVHGKELYWLAGSVLIVAGVLGYFIFRTRKGLVQQLYQSAGHKPVLLLLLCMASYVSILIVSRLFYSDRIPMDERLLSPLLAMGFVLLIWVFAQVWNRNRRLGYAVIGLVCAIMVITNLTRSIQMVQSYHEVGRGYASARDHISETYAYLRNRPQTPVYSNAWVAIYFWTGRVTDPIPSSGGVADMQEKMSQSGAYLVLFDSIPVELYGATREELTQGLIEEIRLSEATIYRSP